MSPGEFLQLLLFAAFVVCLFVAAGWAMTAAAASLVLWWAGR